MWVWPWPSRFKRAELPRGEHPGAFGAVRKFDVHTGVDLYTFEFTPVISVEDGVVVRVLQFTGKAVGSPWWRDTWAVLVEGPSGVVCYGEIHPFVIVGVRVVAGSRIGSVKRVLDSEARSDIPGHLPTMLHLELYKTGTREPVEWRLGEPRPESLLDPTPYLRAAE